MRSLRWECCCQQSAGSHSTVDVSSHVMGGRHVCEAEEVPFLSSMLGHREHCPHKAFRWRVGSAACCPCSRNPEVPGADSAADGTQQK